jgi:hypothetical protein
MRSACITRTCPEAVPGTSTRTSPRVPIPPYSPESASPSEHGHSAHHGHGHGDGHGHAHRHHSTSGAESAHGHGESPTDARARHGSREDPAEDAPKEKDQPRDEESSSGGVVLGTLVLPAIEAPSTECPRLAPPTVAEHPRLHVVHVIRSIGSAWPRGPPACAEESSLRRSVQPASELFIGAPAAPPGRWETSCWRFRLELRKRLGSGSNLQNPAVHRSGYVRKQAPSTRGSLPNAHTGLAAGSFGRPIRGF